MRPQSIKQIADRFDGRRTPVSRCFRVVALALYTGSCLATEIPRNPVAGLLQSLLPQRFEDARSTEMIGPSVSHTSDFQTSGPLSFHVVKVDLSDPQVGIEVEPGKGKLLSGEPVPDIVARTSQAGHRVVAAVNGDFWSMTPQPFSPVGFSVAHGTICTVPHHRSVFAISRDKKAMIGRCSLTVTISAGADRFAVTSVNDLRATSGLALFTWAMGPELPPMKYPCAVLHTSTPEFLPNQEVTAEVMRVDQGRSIALAPGTLVVGLVESSRAGRILKRGNRVQLEAAVPELSGVITQCVGGTPRILRDGRVSVEWEAERTGKGLLIRHPRTSIGITRDGRTVFIVTVDGRQPAISVGQSLTELAEYLKRLGCWDAINLDGGGSTTMVVRGEIVNHPSDPVPRAVSNSVLVVSSAPTGPLARLVIEPKGGAVSVPAGAPMQVKVAGYDSSFNPVDLSQNSIRWEASPAFGDVVASGTEAVLPLPKSEQAGKITVRASSDPSVSASLELHARTPDSLRIDPSVVVLDPGDEELLDLTAFSGKSRLLVQPDMIGLRPSDGTIHTEGLRLHAVGAGQGLVKVKLGTFESELPYYVGHYRRDTLASFDDQPFSITVSGENYSASDTRIFRETSNKHSGAASLGVTYHMRTGGRSRIEIPASIRVEKEPARFALSIYGDGKEEWIRAEADDSKDRKFTLDFTEGSKGIQWRNEWRRRCIGHREITARTGNPGAVPSYPLTITKLSIAQDQEALKASGTIFLDDLEAIYPPD